MEIQVVYSTRTGNTKKVAEAIATVFGIEAVAINEAEKITASSVAIGYWVDKGQPDKDAVTCLKTLEGKRVFLFGTLGAEPDTEHARQCMEMARQLVVDKNEVVGEFLCQGAIDPNLLKMFKKFPPDHPHAMTEERKQRYERAASHPDEADLIAAQEAVRVAFGK